MTRTEPAHNNRKSKIDYSPLRTNLKFDRWSPLATVVYAITSVVVTINVIFIGALFSDIFLSALLTFFATSIVSTALILLSHMFFRRINPAKVDDLFAFAAANNLSARTNPPTTYLSSFVRIMLRYSYLYEPHDWRYNIALWLDGNYKSHPISLYDVALDFSLATGSTIEADMAKAHYAAQDAQTSITLEVYQREAGMLATRKLGLVLWTLPNLTPEVMKKIRHATKWRVADVQTNGTQLAVLLPTSLPYERREMMKLFRLLDRIYEATK